MTRKKKVSFEDRLLGGTPYHFDGTAASSGAAQDVEFPKVAFSIFIDNMDF